MKRRSACQRRRYNAYPCTLVPNVAMHARKRWLAALLVLSTLPANTVGWVVVSNSPNKAPLTRCQGTADDNNREINNEKHRHLEEDIARRLSISKDRAISALSQPTSSIGKKRATNGAALNKEAAKNNKGGNVSNKKASSNEKSPKDSNKSINKSKQPRRKNDRRTTMKRSSDARHRSSSSLLPPPVGEKGDHRPSGTRKRRNNSRKTKPEDSFSSLLPPPLPSLRSDSGKSSTANGHLLSSGLSSWEEFLGRADGGGALSKDKQAKGTSKSKKDKTSSGKDSKLPSISDLFPSDLSSASFKSSSLPANGKPPTVTPKGSSEDELNGVLPVSELFYRSSLSLSTDDEVEDAKSPMSAQDEGDDEELPFSAEQTDELTSDGNKVKIRRNRAEVEERAVQKKKKQTSPKRDRGRKMVRRGMEMLVGGTPINADPPLRAVELSYRMLEEDVDIASWPSAIVTNMRDYGPLLHSGEAEEVTRQQVGLFCEYFANSAMKWDVCPKDLRDIVKSYKLQQSAPSIHVGASASASDCDQLGPVNGSSDTVSVADLISISDKLDDERTKLDEKMSIAEMLKQPEEDNSILSLLRSVDDPEDKSGQAPTVSKKMLTQTVHTYPSPRGFGTKKRTPIYSAPDPEQSATEGEQRWRMFGFMLKFSIGVTQGELEADTDGQKGHALRRVLVRGIASVIKSKLTGLTVEISKLKLHEGDGGATDVQIEFTLEGKGDVRDGDIEKRAARIDAALGQAMDDGDLSLALAAAAKEEPGWPMNIRARVVEEFLFEDDDGDGPIEDVSLDDLDGEPSKKQRPVQQIESLPSQQGSSGELVDSNDSDRVFFDYSIANAHNAPFKGELGPLLYEAATARAIQRHPRVIAIGDVHGCIDELQDLLRLCDYQPGDQVVFLGDLVSKGPDSISVVQMAREIGAIGVRGNHDFEVIRWHQAIKSGRFDYFGTADLF
jgi:hypothetical protein